MVLQIKDVSFSFQKTPILSNLSLHIKKGEFVSIIGKSGSGKSTILRLIAGLLQPDKGEIFINGNPPVPGSISYMPQKDLLLPWRTVMKNLLIVSEIQRETMITKEKVRSWLKKAGLSEWENALPTELSGGMKQRVSFLRTMLMGNEVMLLDEPFGALDAFTKKEMQNWLLSIWEELDKTILFITHDLEEAILLSDKILILHPQGGLEEIKLDLGRPRHLNLIYSTEMAEYKRELEKRIINGMV